MVCVCNVYVARMCVAGISVFMGCGVGVDPLSVGVAQVGQLEWVTIRHRGLVAGRLEPAAALCVSSEYNYN